MENSAIAEKLKRHFQSIYGQDLLVVRSPGRVNIIGEHTDYNEGFVLPAAIDKAVYVGVMPREDDRIELHSIDFSDRFAGSVTELRPVKQHWVNYILGVADQFMKNGFVVRGFNLVIDGDVPVGAGLSSSAAVECATAFALNEIFRLNIPVMKMVRMAQLAEHTFAGVMCGIMDQFASMNGKTGHVMKLDCRSLEWEYVPLKTDAVKILLLNTNVKHSLASTEYNTRRMQCESGVDMIRKKYPGVQSLRDATPAMLAECISDSEILKRCRYVVEENIRLIEGCADLKRNDIGALGKKMFRSHEGLSREYEVSCPELDFLVEFVKNKSGIYGARMMGGGFGGCTINLVSTDTIDQLIKEVKPAYERSMKKELSYYIAEIADGTSVVT